MIIREKDCEEWTGCIWLWIGTSDEHFEHGNEFSGSKRRREIY
jgi:hypothetical protein